MDSPSSSAPTSPEVKTPAQPSTADTVKIEQADTKPSPIPRSGALILAQAPVHGMDAPDAKPVIEDVDA
jgi:hypothetical protein